MHGYFTWFDDKDVTALRLFIRDDALFPLHREVPPGFVITELYRMSNRSPDMSDADVLDHMQSCFEEHYQGWIGFDELRVDSWSESELLIRKNVPAYIASVFGDGEQPFPRDDLLNVGWSENDVRDLENTSHYAYDKQFDPDGYSIADDPVRRWEIPPTDAGGMALVSWKMTIAEFIGDWRMETLRRARQLAPDRCLRIICTFS